MTSHLVVKYDREPLTLQPDTSIDIEDKNPLFNDVGLFSYPIPLPVEGNRYVTRNVDNPQAADRAVELEQKRMDVIVDGLPLRSGVAIVQEGEEIEKTLSMNIDESTRLSIYAMMQKYGWALAMACMPIRVAYATTMSH